MSNPLDRAMKKKRGDKAHTPIDVTASGNAAMAGIPGFLRRKKK